MMRLTGDGWTSESPAVDQMLKRLARKTKSESGRTDYLFCVSRFCLKLDTTPDEIVRSKAEVEEAVQTYCDQYSKSPASANVIQVG